MPVYPVMSLDEKGQANMQAVLDSARVAWKAFATAVEADDFEVAERWAAYLFQLWAAFESVDPSENGWTGRALMLRLEE